MNPGRGSVPAQPEEMRRSRRARFPKSLYNLVLAMPAEEPPTASVSTNSYSGVTRRPQRNSYTLNQAGVPSTDGHNYAQQAQARSV